MVLACLHVTVRLSMREWREGEDFEGPTPARIRALSAGCTMSQADPLPNIL